MTKILVADDEADLETLIRAEIPAEDKGTTL